jgi:Ulp1 family protease
MNDSQHNNADYQMDYLINSAANKSSPLAGPLSQVPEMSQKIANPVTAAFLQGQAKLGDEDAADDGSTQSGEGIYNLFRELDEEADDDQPEDYANDVVGNSIYPSSPGDPGYVNSIENTLVLGNSLDMSDWDSIPKTPTIRTHYLPDPFPHDATFNQICLKRVHHLLIFQYCSNVAFHIHKIPSLRAYKYVDKHNRILACHCGKYRMKIICTDKTVPDDDRMFQIVPTYAKKVISNNEEISLSYEILAKTCRCDKKAITLQPSFLASMPLYHTWMVKSLHPLTKDYSFENIIDKLKDANYEVAFSDTTYSDIKYSVINYICQTISEEYKHVPSMVKALYKLNKKTVSTALQADSEHRFCRWFLGFPIAKYHGVLTQPVYIVDCFHTKCKMYTGRIFLIASRTGFGRTVMEAAAYIPDESAGHICWFVQMCWRHGMKLEDAIFTDQGPFLAAMNALNREFLVSFYTMLCLQHIFRNIHAGFGVLFNDENEKKVFRHMMNTASFCEDQLSFFQTIFDWVNSKISSCPAPRRHLYLTLILYILRLHPALWTVFANTPQFEHDYYKRCLKNDILPALFSALFINLNFRSNQHYELDQAFDFLLSCRASAEMQTEIFLEKFESYITRRGGPCSRLHLARTNIAESQGASFVFCGWRYVSPPRAIPIILNQYNRQIQLLELDLKRTGTGSALTTTGERLKDAVTKHGILFNKKYNAFSGAVSNRNLCGLEILFEDSDGNGDDDDSCASFQEAITPQQSQLQLHTFPTSATKTEEAAITGFGGNHSSYLPAQQSQSNNFDTEAHKQKKELMGYTDSDKSCASSDEVNNKDEDDGTHQSRNRMSTNCDGSIASIASNGEIPDNFMQDAAVEGSFRCKDGRQYTAYLNWNFPAMQNHPFNPSYQHQCNLCILHSSMVQIPCYCILSLAMYAATEDSRFPKHHKKAVLDGALPDDFYPRCFLAERNFSLIQSDACDLKLRIPTQNQLSRYNLNERYLKSPPQYRATIEKGYRLASTGESGKSKKNTRQHGYEDKRKRKSGTFATEQTESVGVCKPIGAIGRAMTGRKNGGRAFETDRGVSEAIADSKVVSGTRLCGSCQQEGHTQNNCAAMYSNHTGVVKPKLIVTGDYIVYHVQDESSHKRLEGQPVELKALSSKEINSRMFRSYNPDEDPESFAAQDQKLISKLQTPRQYKKKNATKKKMEPKHVEMTIKGLKAKFGRTVKDISDKTTSCRVSTNKKLDMVVWLQTNCIPNDDTEIIDTFNDTDIQRALSLENVLASTKRIVSCAHTPTILKFGSQTSMSETEWVMMTVFKIVPESRDVLNRMLLSKNGNSAVSIARNNKTENSVLSNVNTINNNLANNLLKTYGRKSIIQYFGQRTLAKLLTSYVPEIKDNDRIQELLDQKKNSGTAADPIEIDFKIEDHDQSEPILQIFSQVDEGVVEEDEEDDDELQVLTSTTATQLVLTKRDMMSLETTAWLNDAVVSSFFSVIKLTEKNCDPKENLYISSYMFCQLLGIDNNKYDYANANRFIKKKDLFAAKVIFVPINTENSHWILGCIYPSECRIEIFDSGKWIAGHLSKKKNVNITRAKHYGMALLYLMEDRAKSSQSFFDIKKWFIIEKYCPQQRNTWDCGVSVCVNAFFLSNDLPLNYNHTFLGKRRKDVRYSLLLRTICISKNVPAEVRNPVSSLIYEDKTITDLSSVRCYFNIASRFPLNAVTSVIPKVVLGLIMPFFDNSDWLSFVQMVNRASLKEFGSAESTNRHSLGNEVGDDSYERVDDIFTTPGE